MTLSVLKSGHGASIRAKLPDVIVSDIGLPEEDGYSLLRSVRSLNVDGAASVPALAVTHSPARTIASEHMPQVLTPTWPSP